MTIKRRNFRQTTARAPKKTRRLGFVGVGNLLRMEGVELCAACDIVAQKLFDIARTIQRGANNRFYLCQIIWSKPNRLMKP